MATATVAIEKIFSILYNVYVGTVGGQSAKPMKWRRHLIMKKND